MERVTLGLILILIGSGCGGSGSGGAAPSSMDAAHARNDAGAPGEAESEGAESEAQESEAEAEAPQVPIYGAFSAEPTPEAGDRAFLLHGVFGFQAYGDLWTSANGFLLPTPPVVLTHRIDLDRGSSCLVDVRACDLEVDCPSYPEVSQGTHEVTLDDPVVSVIVGLGREIAQPYECDANARGFAASCTAGAPACVAGYDTRFAVVPLGDPARCGPVCVTYEPDACAEDLPRDSTAPCECPEGMCHDGVCRPRCRR